MEAAKLSEYGPRSAGETVALTHEPTAPYHSTQDALRVLETVAGRPAGVTDTELARRTGLAPTG